MQPGVAPVGGELAGPVGVCGVDVAVQVALLPGVHRGATALGLAGVEGRPGRRPPRGCAAHRDAGGSGSLGPAGGSRVGVIPAG